MADETESWPPLHRAARNGDVNEISDLIAQGADVAAVVANNTSALYIAAQEGHAKAVETLIKYKANVNAQTADGSTALYIAAQEGKTEVVNVLVKVPGVDLNQGNQGATPLHMAAQRGWAETAEALLKGGADVNAQTKRSGKTPLHMAATTTNEKMIDVLIRYGARLDIKTVIDPKKTPEELAIELGHVAIAMKLKPNPYTVKAQKQVGVIDLKTLNQGGNAAHHAPATAAAPSTSGSEEIDAKVKKFVTQVAQVPDTLNNFKGLKWKQFRALSKTQLISNGVKDEDAVKILKGFDKLDKKAAAKKTGEKDKPTQRPKDDVK